MATTAGLDFGSNSADRAVILTIRAGTLLAASGPQTETSRATHTTLLLFLSWSDDDLHGPHGE
jgi:ribulose kinase